MTTMPSPAAGRAHRPLADYTVGSEAGRRAAEAGSDRHFTNPVDPGELAAMLRGARDPV